MLCLQIESIRLPCSFRHTSFAIYLFSVWLVLCTIALETAVLASLSRMHPRMGNASRTIHPERASAAPFDEERRARVRAPIVLDHHGTILCAANLASILRSTRQVHGRAAPTRTLCPGQWLRALSVLLVAPTPVPRKGRRGPGSRGRSVECTGSGQFSAIAAVPECTWARRVPSS